MPDCAENVTATASTYVTETGWTSSGAKRLVGRRTASILCDQVERAAARVAHPGRGSAWVDREAEDQTGSRRVERRRQALVAVRDRVGDSGCRLPVVQLEAS